MDLSGKTILVTGSTDGVGKETARRLAQAGCRVLLHGRNTRKGQAVAREIAGQTGNGHFEFFAADFASLENVRELGRAVLQKHAQLDVLINNAGIGVGADRMRRQTSHDGHELRFAVNYLAPFLLTHMLLPALRASESGRIVNVASAGQEEIDFGDVMLTRGYEGWRAYRRSKLALVMFTLDLAEQLDGSNVTVNCLHPATFMNTKMVTESGIEPTSTVEEGADAIVHLATSPGLQGWSGLYFDGRQPERAHAQAYDATARRKLRELSEELTQTETVAPASKRS